MNIDLPDDGNHGWIKGDAFDLDYIAPLNTIEIASKYTSSNSVVLNFSMYGRLILRSSKLDQNIFLVLSTYEWIYAYTS